MSESGILPLRRAVDHHTSGAITVGELLERGELPHDFLPRMAEAEILFNAVQNEASLDRLIATGRLDLNRPFGGSRQPVLHMAVRNIRFERSAIELLIRKGADIQQMDDFGLTPLHWALIEACRSAEWLIELGADVHIAVRLPPAVDPAPMQANIQVAAAGSGGTLEHVIAAKYGGATPLHIAARRRFSLAQLFVTQYDAASDILREDCRGDTALHAAVQGGSPDIFLALLEAALANVPPTDRDNVVDVKNHMLRTPLHYAVSGGATYITPLLLQHGADPLAKDISGATPLHYAAIAQRIEYVEPMMQILLQWAYQRHPQDPCHIDVTDNEGKTALHWAADAGSPEAVGLLTGVHGANLNAVDNRRRTPLYFALFRRDSCDMAVAERLIIQLEGNGENINEEIHRCMKLHFSVGTANGQWIEETCGQLHFPGCNATDIVEELPPIYLALCMGRQDIAEFIQRHTQGVPETAINKGGRRTGRSALHWATVLGDLDMVRRLCRADLPITKDLMGNAEDIHGKTALEYAREMKHRLIEKELLERSDIQRYVEGLYRDRQVYVDAANAVLVGAALIAGVTFAGWLQPPLGYTEYVNLPPAASALSDPVFQSYAAVQQHLGVRVFWFFNSLSFSFAVAAVIAALVGVIPSRNVFIAKTVLFLRKTLLIAVVLLAFSILFVLVAFATAGFTVLPPIFKYQANMVATVIVGGIPCLLLLGWLSHRLWASQRPAYARDSLGRPLHAFPLPSPAPPPADHHPRADNYFVLDNAN